MSSEITAIDLSAFDDPARAAAAGRALDEACRRTGFMVVTGHGIDPDLIARMHRLAGAFFAQPMEKKMEIALGKVSRDSGYQAIGMSTLAATSDRDPDARRLDDLKESLGIGPIDWDSSDPYYSRGQGGRFFVPNAYPAEPEGLAETYKAYYRAMGLLGRRIMRAAAIAMDLPETVFDDKVDRHISHLFVQHYPALAAAPLPGQMRAGAHTDFGCITILHLGDNGWGLQVQTEQGVWRDVGCGPDAFIVNIGDLLAQWSNDRWVSTLHRVVVPDDERAQRARQTITFFHQPNYDAEVACLPSCVGPDNPCKYAPTTSGTHYAAKIAALRGEAAE